jgi:selenocysteine-specific elongation factor
MNEYTLIGKNLFKKETDMNMFVGLKVIRTSNGAEGVIESAFGKSGKFKVNFPDGKQTDTQGSLLLRYKRYAFSKDKKLVQ